MCSCHAAMRAARWSIYSSPSATFRQSRPTALTSSATSPRQLSPIPADAMCSRISYALFNRNTTLTAIPSRSLSSASWSILISTAHSQSWSSVKSFVSSVTCIHACMNCVCWEYDWCSLYAHACIHTYKHVAHVTSLFIHMMHAHTYACMHTYISYIHFPHIHTYFSCVHTYCIYLHVHAHTRMHWLHAYMYLCMYVYSSEYVFLHTCIQENVRLVCA